MLLCPSMIDTNSCLLYALIGRKSTDLPYAVGDFFLVFFSLLWLVGWFTDGWLVEIFFLGGGCRRSRPTVTVKLRLSGDGLGLTPNY